MPFADSFEFKMEDAYNQLAHTVGQCAGSHIKPRYLVAIAGVPGSGKTTTAEAVTRLLNSNTMTKATLISMDGFHLDRATLDQLPNREEAYSCRGAPWTFDVPRLVTFMRKLRAWADSDSPTPGGGEPGMLFAPGFNHETMDPVANAVRVTDDTNIVIIEGNYLLLDEPEWREVAELVDYRVFIAANLGQTRERLAKRHVKSGIEKTLADAFCRVDSNDIRNSLSIQEKLITPDMIISSVTGAGVTH
jgi:pantothenate kinase